MPAPKGHPKWGGKPKGHKTAATLSKEAIRARIQARVAAELDPLLDAQISNAKGIEYLVARDAKTGKFTPIEDKARIADATEIWLKQPNVQAFTDLLNRAADKPKEQPQDINLTGSLDIVEILRQRHERHAPKD